MRASSGAPHEEGGRHLTGAERLVPTSELEATVLELLRRAEERGAFGEHVRISIDPVSIVTRAKCLDVTTVSAPASESAMRIAAHLVGTAGVSNEALSAGLQLLVQGRGGSGMPIRGAALIDAATGDRLDPDPTRGIRASRFDYAPEARDGVQKALAVGGLAHFRTFEALAVATKVLWAGVAAEYCWSDDPDYDAGYIATPQHGYVRFPCFRPPGATGGRLFFLRPESDPNAIIWRLEQAALLIATAPEVRVIDTL